MRYGERLKQARLHAGLTQEELSERIGRACSQENISVLERSPTATGSEYTVQFAEACGVRPQWLAMEQGDMVESSTDYYRVKSALTDPKKVNALLLMEALPDYAVDTVIKDITEISELIARSRANHH